MPSNSIRGSDSPALEKTAIHVHRAIAVWIRRSVTRNGHANQLGECRMGFQPGEADRQLNLSSRFLLSPVRFERAHRAAPNMPARDAAFARSPKPMVAMSGGDGSRRAMVPASIAGSHPPYWTRNERPNPRPRKARSASSGFP